LKLTNQLISTPAVNTEYCSVSMTVMVDLLCTAGREAVAETGALAGPRGWSRDVAHLEKL